MTMTGTLLLVAAVLAVGDWLAVHYRFFRVEFVLKPATLVGARECSLDELRVALDGLPT